MEQQIAMNGTAPFLPKEIITNILKRLPVKSLIRFQCVCQHWKNLFKNPSFIADHLRHSGHHNPHFLFFDTFSYGRRRHNPTQLKLLNCQMQIRDLQNPPLLDSLRAGLVKIIGSRNGLVCFAIRENNLASSPSSVFLWNPATTDAREVPRSRITDSCVFGFGFSSSLNDYKIVAIAGHIDLRVEVYSLSRDSWEEIEIENFSEHLIFFGETTVSSNEAIFWKGFRSGEERKEEVIVSFDTAKEVFTFIPWPTDTALNTHMSFHSVNLTVYKDKLAIFHSGRDGSLWVTEEDIGSSRERWNWTTKFIDGHYPWMLNCVGTIWRNEIVMVGSTETRGKEGQRTRLCLVNLTTNEFKMIDIVLQYWPTLFLNYVESLVPIFNIHNIEEP
ncbi:hypothetical protein K1719_001673 [Acacia pycnantha]|nr:hypothetical protein K1719_001673 [Acacia pycnantha]